MIRIFKENYAQKVMQLFCEKQYSNATGINKL